MNKPRPFLTALCFALFAAVFVSTNVRPEALYCAHMCAEQDGPLQHLAEDLRRLVRDASRPRREP